ncbi:MAG TPA: TIR domain-containing protein [Steroidobacteraceae bacterium]|nr:TIR domain-containing protein [Steroidobacteraceae bacterium]
MTGSKKAVFLSYASQDAEAARHIVAALRSAGIEVWFDQSELRGGDAWDRQISKQIRDCALFIALISTHTNARAEGYFRREWRIAVDRTRDMADDEAFLLPVVIDDTPDATARVPDKFREVQWTRLPGGVAPAAFAERLGRLLAPQERDAPTPTRLPAGAVPVTDDLRDSSSPSYRPAKGKFASTWWSRPVLLLAAAVVIALAYFLVDRIVLSKRVAEAAKPSALLAREASLGPIPIAIPEKSIAVLPFVDMSEKKDQEYFSDGLAEELLDLLSQVPDLRVPARTSSFYFKGKSDDIANIAQKLRVAHVLEGSVRKAGNTIRVTAQLIRADNGYHLWSKTYDRGIKDIFKVQDEIAAAVVDALKAQLLPAQQISSRHRTGSTEAYTEYLLGNQFRARDVPAANRQARAAYQKAVALDPGYAAAYSGLATAEWRIADQLIIDDPAAYQRAAAAADKAIALAPDSPEGYWSRGLLRNSYYFDWHGAEVDFQKALALDANFVPAQVDYAYLLATFGRSADAIAMTHMSLALDPLSVPAWHVLALLLVNSGQFSEARVAARRLAEVNPGGNNLAFGADADLFEGRTLEALEGYRRAGGPIRLMGQAMAEYTLGHAAESQRALEKLLEMGDLSLGYQIADVYAWRRENDKAFEWLERAYQRHDGGLGYVTYDRYLVNLRSDPRYTALLRKLKLSE